MKKLFSILLALVISESIVAQAEVSWTELEDVTFEEFYDRDRSEWSLQAEFAEDIQSLEGTEIEITGYVIPLDVSGEVYVLSAFAFTSCFFCGGAGPESVMGLEFSESPGRMHTDDVISVKGTLRLNVNPGLEFHYMLDNVEITKKF